MGEEQRPATARAGYRMVKRAHHVDETRQRIVAATVDLHGTVGPANTTISAIAKAAGVTRATVYHHFPDLDALFTACTAHWGARQQMPDLAGWQEITGPQDRVRAALTDLYRFYGEAEPMLALTTRDREALPAFVRERNQQTARSQLDVLLSAWPASQRTRKRRALLGHAIAFATWRSLCVDQGLPQHDAVAAMTRMVVDC